MLSHHSFGEWKAAQVAGGLAVTLASGIADANFSSYQRKCNRYLAE